MKTDWKDDMFEGKLRRYTLINNDDGTVSLQDATDYTQQGDVFGANELNAIGAEVNETKKSVSDGKTLIAAAITAKRVAAAASDTFAVLANKIGQIVLGSGNAAKADVLKGKTFTNNDGVEYTGTMENKSGTAQSASASLDTTNSRVVMTVPATAKYDTASKLYAAYSTIRTLIGLTADKLWYNTTILGLKSSRSGLAAKTYTPGTANQTIAAGTCITGAQTIKGDANLKAANIKKGVTIFGIAGTWEGYVAGEEDLYKYGVNAANFTLSSGETFESGAIYCTHTALADSVAIATTKAYDLSRYTNINLEVTCTATRYTYEKFAFSYAKSGETVPTTYVVNTFKIARSLNNRRTVSIPISNLNLTPASFRVIIESSDSSELGSGSNGYWDGQVHRIWFS